MSRRFGDDEMNMTQFEIKNLPAGRGTDALIAEKVLKLNTPNEDYPCPICGSEMWHGKDRARCSVCNEWRYSPYKEYSSDISAAWEVVEKLCDENGCDIVRVCKRDPELLRGEWSCNFGLGFEAFGETASLAICRAALLMILEISDGHKR